MSAQHSHATLDASQVQAPSLDAARKIALVIGIVGLMAAVAFAMVQEEGLRRLQFAWLYGCSYFLTISLGALFFVLLQHVTKAGWSVVVRRLAEHVMTALPVMALLLLPLVIMVLTGNGDLYMWADLDLVKNHEDVVVRESQHLFEHKAGYLNATFFAIRFLVYIAVWVFLVRYFKRRSFAQDQDGNPMHTVYMNRVSAPGMFLFALSLTFCSFDFLMALDAPWFSTMWGVYIFAGSFLSFMCLLGLMAQRGESKGYLRGVVTKEHYHDIGKLMFAFVFFWSYVSFSQFMLIWYADIPEETLWFAHRSHGGYMALSYILIFGHCLIPFVGLLSRHVKRNPFGLRFWAIWLLVMHALDLYWVIMPNFNSHHMGVPLLEILCLISVGGIFAFVVLGSISGKPMAPTKDPRLPESLSFQNV